MESGDERFNRLFNEALSRIPDDVRPVRSVGRVSLRKAGSLPGLVGMTRWSARGQDADDGRASLGQRCQGRQTITYYSSLLDYLSDGAYIAVIAHELAHAWLNEHVLPHQSAQREREADELAARWGFEEELAQLESEAENVGESVY